MVSVGTICHADYGSTSDSTVANLMSPCNTLDEDDIMRMFTLSMVPKEPAPDINSMVIFTQDKKSITVEISISAEGTIYCGSFKAEMGAPSIASIKLQQKQADANATTSALIVLDGLIPSTDYHVYCATQSAKMGTLMTVDNVIATKKSATTSCCKYVDVSNSLSYSYTGEVLTLNPVTVTLESL